MWPRGFHRLAAKGRRVAARFSPFGRVVLVFCARGNLNGRAQHGRVVSRVLCVWLCLRQFGRQARRSKFVRVSLLAPIWTLGVHDVAVWLSASVVCTCGLACTNLDNKFFFARLCGFCCVPRGFIVSPFHVRHSMLCAFGFIVSPFHVACICGSRIWLISMSSDEDDYLLHVRDDQRQFGEDKDIDNDDIVEGSDDDNIVAVAAPALDAPAAVRTQSWCHQHGLPGPRQRTAFEHAAICKVAREKKSLKAEQQDPRALVSMDGGPSEAASVLEVRDVVELGATTTVAVTSIATQLKVSRAHVRNCFSSLALCTWSLITKWMMDMLIKFRDSPPLLFWDRLKMDETEQKLTIVCESKLLRDQQRTSWSVLVRKRVVGWLARDGDVVDHILPCLPTILLASKNVGAYHDGTTTQRNILQVNSFINLMRRWSDDWISVRETDAAGPVMKALQHEANQLATDVNNEGISSIMACGIHQNVLNTGAIANDHAKEPVAALSHFAAVQREGNVFLRMNLALEDDIDQRLIIKREPPSAILNHETKIKYCLTSRQ